MNNWKLLQIGKAIKFNPPVSIPKKSVAKKIPMGMLTEFQRKINGYEYSSYSSGPKFENGDTLFAKITPCLENGKTAFVDILEENETAFGSSEFIVLRKTEYTDSKYIYYLAISPIFRKRAISCMEGTSGRKRVNENVLKHFELPFPLPVEQKKIAKVLSDLDAKIELNNKINAELEATAKLIYDYWFVQFDFPDENGKPYKSSGGKMVYNQELKREIPEGWEVKRLRDIVKYNYDSLGKNSSLANINYLDTSSLTKNKIENLQSLNPEIDKIPSRAQRVVNKNDMLYSTVRPNQCHYGIVKDPSANMVASTGFVQMSSKIGLVSNDLIYTFLTLDWVTERLQQIASLSVSSYPSISPNDLLDLKIALPSEGELLEVTNNKFEKIYSKVSKGQSENNKLAELRDWLLPMLMNGQVKVK